MNNRFQIYQFSTHSGKYVEYWVEKGTVVQRLMEDILSSCTHFTQQGSLEGKVGKGPIMLSADDHMHFTDCVLETAEEKGVRLVQYTTDSYGVVLPTSKSRKPKIKELSIDEARKKADIFNSPIRVLPQYAHLHN